MTGSKRAIVAAVSLCAGGLSACGGAEADTERPPRPVVWAEAEAWQGSETSRYIGRLENAEAPTLAFEVAGSITDIRVDRGDRFARGDVLARLDDRTYALDVERRDAAIRQAEATLANAEIDYSRKAALRGTGAIAGSVIDAAEAARDTARSAVAELTAARGQAEKSRSDTRLRAPFSGQVIRRVVEPGATVAGGAPVLEVAADEAPLQAAFLVSEDDIGRLDVGRPVTIGITAQDRRVAGTVAEIGTTAAASLAFPVAVDLSDRDGLRAGMTAVLDLGEAMDGPGGLVLLPAPAVQTGPQRSYVAVLDGETVRFRDVGVSSVRDEGVVVSGLDAGQRIVTRGTAQLRDGQTVVPLDPDARRYPD